MDLRQNKLHICPIYRQPPDFRTEMSDCVEDPFQMDEDIRRKPDDDLPFSACDEINDSNPPNSTLDSDITPRYTEPAIIQDSNTMYTDSKLLRTRLQHIKLEEGAGTTTEEDELTYEEDADDKFDAEAAARIEADFISREAQSLVKSLTPPENFAPVINNIYRSSFPQPPNFSFLKTLKLKSVLCLIPEEYPQSHEDFFEQEGIQLFQLGMSGNKEPFVKISGDLITEAIKIVINPENQPILIHCNRGKHRTGCLVGVLRRLQRWSLTIIFDEYRKFAAPKERPMDQQFIELYDATEVVNYAEENGLLPLQWY